MVVGLRTEGRAGAEFAGEMDPGGQGLRKPQPRARDLGVVRGRGQIAKSF